MDGINGRSVCMFIDTYIHNIHTYIDIYVHIYVHIYTIIRTYTSMHRCT
jgi:hypothetical protein